MNRFQILNIRMYHQRRRTAHWLLDATDDVFDQGMPEGGRRVLRYRGDHHAGLLTDDEDEDPTERE
ncbi:MAG: hypothetical protein H5U29_04440 [Pusillimonas sp.]|nr:hypothetical protein [Pusillimonas sp.]